MATASLILANLCLAFSANNLRRHYGVIFNITQDCTFQKIHFVASISCNSTAISGDPQLYIDKQQIFLNDKVPDTLLDTLADHCGKILYPLQARMSNRGVFKGIENGMDILERWQHARPGLAQYYKGKIAENILTGMDVAVSNQLYLTEMIKRDWLITLLCSPIYQNYQNYEYNVEVGLPIIPYKTPVKYSLFLKVAPQRTESGFILIEGAGNCIDSRRLSDILKGDPVLLEMPDNHEKATGSVALIYKLYPHNGTIFSVTGHCTLTLHDGIEKRIEIEMYQLGKRDFIPDMDGSESVILDEAPAAKKSGWLSFFK